MDGFKEGYDFFLNNSGSLFAPFMGAEYIDSIRSRIEQLISDLNSFKGYQTDADKLKGDITEFWHAGTHDINAAIRGSGIKATVNRSHDLGSADVTLSDGASYSSKYYGSGDKSAREQAISVFERFKRYQSKGGQDPIEKYLKDNGFSDDTILSDPLYSGQMRIIPKGQMEEAIRWLKRRIAEESVGGRSDQIERYEETLALLTDRIRDSKGNESIPLTREDAERLAKMAKEGKVSSNDLGLTTEELVSYEYILQQAFKAGLTSAAITAVMKLAPEIIRAISHLIDSGEISSGDFKRMGFAALSGGAEGFIRGTVSAGLTAACKAGLLGEAAKAINPNAIGMAVVLLFDTMKNAFEVAIGRISKREMTDAMVRETFIAANSFISGMIAQILLPEVPALGFLLGSFVGSVVGGLTYTAGYNLMVSFCVDTGFTFFGLVKQNYVLPEEVVKQIGVAQLYCLFSCSS